MAQMLLSGTHLAMTLTMTPIISALLYRCCRRMQRCLLTRIRHSVRWTVIFGNGFATPNYITPITVGALIRKMQLIPSVQIVPSADGGGNPYDSFQYYVTDGLRNSKSATIQIYRKCWPGTYLDQSKRKCLPCSPGFFSTGYSYNTVCTPCPVGTSQPRAGSSTCVPCQQAVFISYTANATSINSTSSNNTFVPSSSTIKLPSTVVGIEDISSFGSFQEGTGQATCNACAGLTYALVEKATSCEGKAFIPKYVSLGGGSSSAYPSVSGMILGSGSSSFSSLISVLNPAYRTNDVSSAMDKAMILDAPRAVVVTGCLIAGITLLGLIGTFLFINDPVIKASSPIALSITAAGIIMGALSVVTYSVEPSKGSCIAEIWMLPVSFSIVIGMLISKTFRILRIFNNPRALKIRMTNADLFGYMVAATSGNVAILIIWSIFDPPTPVVISRGNSDGMNFIYCGSKSAAVQSGFTVSLVC
ncbi:7 transmembrane sweet-taste receptor of 3 GCPR-domain-containing protein [Chytridium lagenaria]|nr:7 transmembrane sweet-taste receptor of 3 GCPR-domain-containing protein [Chytridium lagenaria]